MRTRLAALAVVLSFVATVSASAGTITSVSPSSVKVNSGEHFISVYGSGLSNGTLVFDGPAGHFERTVNASFTGYVVGWVPEAIVRTSGLYSLYVRDSFGAQSNSVSFSVQGFKYFPLVILSPDVLFVQALNRDGAYIKYDVFAYGGEDSNYSVRCFPESGTFVKMGSTTVNCEAANASGETAKSDFVVHVADRAAPTIYAPREPIVVKAESNEGTRVEFSADANDDVYGQLATDCLPRSGSIFPVGKTTVDCSATDYDGNVGHAFFLVEVIGDIKPYELVIKVPNDIYVDARDVTGTTVDWSAKVVNSEDPYVVLDCTHKSGQLYPIGETRVTCTALDGYGLRGTSTFAINVVDPMGPWIDRVIATPNVLRYDDRIYSITVEAWGKDDIDPQPHCAIFSVTANEDINVDDSDSEKNWDWSITGDLTVDLRARYGRSGMRTYNVWVGCSDWYGNMTSKSVPVYVTKDGTLPSTVAAPSKRRAAGKP
jgi:hypothetical protein